MPWVFGDGIDICKRFCHPAIFHFLDLFKLSAIFCCALINPVNQRDDDLEGLRTPGVDAGGDKAFDELVHPVPDNAIKAIHIELSFRACKEVSPAHRALAFA